VQLGVLAPGVRFFTVRTRRDGSAAGEQARCLAAATSAARVAADH
jgi:hypothetical protein